MTGREDAKGDADVDRTTAFGRLTDRQLTASYRLASLLLGSSVEGQDAVQDAAIIAWQRFASLRDPDRFDGWFQRIVVNACRDRLRARSRVRTIPIDGLPDTGSPLTGAGLGERDALRQAILELSVDQRTVIVLRYFADLPLEEIAQQTGERLGTVKSRLHYALEALHAAYDAGERTPDGRTR